MRQRLVCRDLFVVPCSTRRKSLSQVDRDMCVVHRKVQQGATFLCDVQTQSQYSFLVCAGVACTRPAAPLSPNAPYLTAAPTASGLQLTWDEPVRRGAPISSYIVEMCRASDLLPRPAAPRSEASSNAAHSRSGGDCLTSLDCHFMLYSCFECAISSMFVFSCVHLP
jgi:hypothetical protein